ncbi:CrcB family protein [Herbiconiux sp. VKM Ac-1786]|uniref:fluoride efflux transporter FluC n=1 Tax=Herbiconiux sp. VKM Ac-1786 TaxID=2783824 RepID=UPI00188B9B0C|nr:CrcB family protein [Herbiconiux sp. VKM Ac-1786]
MTRARRADHLRAGPVALVAAGGAVGTALRAGIALVVHPVGGFPVAIFGINIVGAFVLGMLLQALTARGADTGRRRTLRLFVGTGVLGGFTTYSALSSDSAVLLTSGGLALALAYGLATVLLGALASWGGIALGAALGSPEGRDRMPVDSDASGDPR